MLTTGRANSSFLWMFLVCYSMVQGGLSLILPVVRTAPSSLPNPVLREGVIVLFASREKSARKQKSPSPKAGTGFGSRNKKPSAAATVVFAGSSASVRQRLARAARTYDEIRKTHGVSNSRDVYVRSPKNSLTTYWFVGKIGFVEPTITPITACLLQKRLILEYAASLRPQNMGGPIYSKELEIWLAPADSEMDVVRNMVVLEPVRGSAADVVLPAHQDENDNDDVVVTRSIHTLMGYNPEIYVGDEITQGGLRVQRDEQGRPMKPVFDVNESV